MQGKPKTTTPVLVLILSMLCAESCGQPMEVKPGCEALCELQETCLGPLPDGLAACVGACEQSYKELAQDLGDACAKKVEDIDQCVGALACEQFEVYLMNSSDVDGPCGEFVAAAQETCAKAR